MARVFIDGAESGSTTLWNSTVQGLTIEAAGGSGFSGVSCFRVENSSGDRMTRNMGATKAELYVAFKMYCTSSGTLRVLWTFYDSAGAAIATLTRNAANLLEARRGSYTGTVLGTGSTAILSNTFYLIEIHYKPLDAGGDFEVKVDGNPVLDIDYAGDTTLGLQNIQYFGVGQSVAYCNTYYDDIVVDDAGWIGNTRIQGISPMGAGATTEWDASAGNNWDCVDEIPHSDADYISTNVSNEVDTYETGNLVGTIATIKCIQVSARAAKEGASTPTQLQIVVRPGETDRVSASKALPTAFGVSVYAIWETNPDTESDPWNSDSINAAEIGVKAVA